MSAKKPIDKKLAYTPILAKETLKWESVSRLTFRKRRKLWPQNHPFDHDS